MPGDGPNFSNIFKTMTPDVSRGKDTGYTLTARGLAEATDLVEEMVGAEA